MLLHNAGVLEADLAQVDDAVLSHGHFDHTGGLLAFLRQAGGCRVHAHPQALEPTYAVSDTESRSIGLPASRAEYERGSATPLARRHARVRCQDQRRDQGIRRVQPSTVSRTSSVAVTTA